MFLRVSQGEPKPQKVNQPLVCILDSFNKFSEVLTDQLPNVFPLHRLVDHKIKVVPRLVPPSKAPHRINQMELKEF